MANILYVEDNDTIRQNFSKMMEKEGFEVTAFADSHSALQQFEVDRFDLAVLDITLGNETEGGFELCMELRKRSQSLPIIFFTSHDSDFDKISGMRLGADDYLTRDININYLLVRIKALLRRVKVLSGSDTQTPEVLKQGDLMLNMGSLYAEWKNQPIHLSLTQLWLVYAMANQPGHARSLRQLMEAANLTIQPNTVAAHIKTIRDLFLKIDPDFNSIKTERGIGYRWVSAETTTE